jgi:hypothetical protein
MTTSRITARITAHVLFKLARTAAGDKVDVKKQRVLCARQRARCRTQRVDLHVTCVLDTTQRHRVYWIETKCAVRPRAIVSVNKHEIHLRL